MSAGWAPSWRAVVCASSDAALPEPILGIGVEGTEPGRFAPTTLNEAGATDAVRRHEAPVAAGDGALPETLQAGEVALVDPGRDHALARLSLRGSRWAIGAAPALCEAGGPDWAEPGGDWSERRPTGMRQPHGLVSRGRIVFLDAGR